MENRFLHIVRTAEQPSSKVSAFLEDQISKSLAAKRIDVETANRMRKELRNPRPADPTRWAEVKICGELPTKVLYFDSVFGWTAMECTGDEKFFVGIDRRHD